MDNDRIFVSTSYMEGSAAVAWAAASSGILSPGENDEFVGELLIHMDGRATFKWWDGNTPYVLVIQPEANAPGGPPFVAVYETEDQPPFDGLAPVVWQSTDTSAVPS